MYTAWPPYTLCFKKCTHDQQLHQIPPLSVTVISMGSNWNIGTHQYTTTPRSTTSSSTTTTVTATTWTASKFRQRWKSNYPWLTYDTTGRLMFCSRHKKNNQYASGTKNFKHTNILRHAYESQKGIACQSLSSVCTQSYSEKRKAVMAAIRNVYWLAKDEIATLKYGSLNELTLLQGCPDISHLSVAKNAQYTSPHIAEEMQDALSDCLKEDLKGLCQEADFVGILIDESTDISVTHNLCSYHSR